MTSGPLTLSMTEPPQEEPSAVSQSSTSMHGEYPVIHVDASIPAKAVTDVLDRLIETRENHRTLSQTMGRNLPQKLSMHGQKNIRSGLSISIPANPWRMVLSKAFKESSEMSA